MTKYDVAYWEKETVWVRRRAIVESDKKPTKDTIEGLLEGDGDVDFYESDYNYETSEHDEYDFDTDFEVEEVK